MGGGCKIFDGAVIGVLVTWSTDVGIASDGAVENCSIPAKIRGRERGHDG